MSSGLLLPPKTVLTIAVGQQGLMQILARRQIERRHGAQHRTGRLQVDDKPVDPLTSNGRTRVALRRYDNHQASVQQW